MARACLQSDLDPAVHDVKVGLQCWVVETFRERHGETVFTVLDYTWVPDVREPFRLAVEVLGETRGERLVRLASGCRQRVAICSGQHSMRKPEYQRSNCSKLGDHCKPRPEFINTIFDVSGSVSKLTN